MLAKSLAAAGLLGAWTFSAASAAPLGSQAGLGGDGGLVMQAQVKITNPNVGKYYAKPPAKLTNPNIGKYYGKPPVKLTNPNVGKYYGTPGGKGKGSGPHYHLYGGLVLATSYCAYRAERCAVLYGEGTWRFWRCLRRAGC